MITSQCLPILHIAVLFGTLTLSFTTGVSRDDTVYHEISPSISYDEWEEVDAMNNDAGAYGSFFSNRTMSWYQKNLNVVKSNTVTNVDPTKRDRDSERELFWDIYSLRNKVKVPPTYTNSTYEEHNDDNNANNMMTLTSFKYFILPIWWMEDDEMNPANRIDVDMRIMNQTKQYYYEMSWDKFEITFELLPQQKMNISRSEPLFRETKRGAIKILHQIGYLKGSEAFEGIILVYPLAQKGPFSTPGGKAYMNDNIFWLSKNFEFTTVRHEIGHNLGHQHHRSMNGYRKDPNCQCDFDGFDMMSGGNKYNVSHFALASKWFFNWVPDFSIVLMQPEGTTNLCPNCLSEGTFKLFAFDKYDQPPRPDKTMGIQIPIMGDKTGTMYSYWLSYRSGVNGLAAIGLSVHLSWFSLGGIFGAYYDSLSYDANGDTDSRFDSFVLPGTCYIIEPPLNLIEVDSLSAEQILPKVCVDHLNKESDITITVSFIDPKNSHAISTSKISKPPDETLQCTTDNGTSLNRKVDSTSPFLIHVSGAGNHGILSTSLCTTGGTNQSSVSAYIYDRYPYAPLVLGAPYSYSAFSSITAVNCRKFDSKSQAQNNDTASLPQSFETTKFNDAWLMIVPSSEGNELEIDVKCQVTECHANQYLSHGKCEMCSNGISPIGSTQHSQCIPCAGGFEPVSSRVPKCELSERFDTNIVGSRGWRIWTPNTYTTNVKHLYINELEFYSSSNCSEPRIDPFGIFIDSGNMGPDWSAVNAFEGIGQWRGKPDFRDNFWLGIIYGNNTDVSCVSIDLAVGHEIQELRVQAYVNGRWENVWIEKNIKAGGEYVAWVKETASPSTIPSSEPSFTPTFKPSFQPSFVPSLLPSFKPSASPSSRPSTLPSAEPSTFPSIWPSSHPTSSLRIFRRARNKVWQTKKESIEYSQCIEQTIFSFLWCKVAVFLKGSE